MRKLDPEQLSKAVDDLLDDCHKSYRLAEKIINHIHEQDAELLAFKNYIFICPYCKENAAIDEVKVDISVTQRINRINIDGDGEVSAEYGVPVVEDTDNTVSWLQCSSCGHQITDDDMGIVISNMQNPTEE